MPKEVKHKITLARIKGTKREVYVVQMLASVGVVGVTPKGGDQVEWLPYTALSPIRVEEFTGQVHTGQYASEQLKKWQSN